MPRHLVLVHLGRAKVNADHIGDLTSPVRPTTPRLTRTFALPQAKDELFTQLPNRQRIDGGVNRLVTDIGVFKLG